MKTASSDTWKIANVSFMDETARLEKNVLKEKLKHDAFGKGLPPYVKLIPMTVAEEEGMEIAYDEFETALGNVLLASTGKGICYAGFILDEPAAALNDLKRRFPRALFTHRTSSFLEQAIRHFNSPALEVTPLVFHLKGTRFQLEIWERLLHIPFGAVTSYGALGGKHARATGGAVGDNPVSYLIPCHRVIRSDGSFEGYFWGNALKRKLLCLESIHLQK